MSVKAQKKILEELSFLEIENKIDSLISINGNTLPVIKHYIKKSKKENNDQALIYAFRYASKATPEDIGYKYADSAIVIAKKTNNNELISEALLNKGVLLMDYYQYEPALDYILQAKEYLNNVKNDYINYKTLYFIAQNRMLLGQITEAKKHLSICVDFFKQRINEAELGYDYKTYYSYSLMSLIDCNTKLKKHSENNSLYKEAYEFINKNNARYLIPYFISCEGTDAYYLKNYSVAINKLKKAQHLYQDSWPHYTEIFYIGMSYWKLGNKKQAVKYFEKLDKEYYKDKNQDPQFRPAYELLIEYYASKNNTNKQLEYINKLMSLDKSYEKNYKYLFAKIHKEYDTKKLIDEKNSIENNLKIHQYITIFIITLSILIISFSTYKYLQMQRRYRERFKQMISQKNTEIEKMPVTIVEENKKTTPKIAGLSESTITYILEQLEIFEKEQLFLDSKITQKLLSEKLGTNPTYLSKIINTYKKKNFSNYLNDLRLEYIVELLKTEHKYLNRDIKELANIAGFTNAEAFSDNFQRKFEIKPYYFIKMMRENIKTYS
ncbi:helix-turn-helix domain-containing protein [Cloacibacterium sp. TD35]|uniref:helix-turn-helix domain-containing protein n=1 Tax=Cloacibacterium sp. TD35 TaxID=2976818 RepID=UPI00237DA570|nr:helix-turn-helix domain-containing protein [Cloacibacterium sp. TD35]WDT67541.1 helix-turn-helix domain-containing protein [Cloacibacterium sp. TD35]